MDLRDASEQIPTLRDSWQPGLQALRAQDRAHIRAGRPQQLRGSIDVDLALRPSQPHANRWDFAIGYRHAGSHDDFIYWVEVHTAAEDQIPVVLRKLAWLRGWLSLEGRPLGKDNFDRQFIWISSGRTTFTPDSPQSRRLAQSGLKHVGRVLRILPSHR